MQPTQALHDADPTEEVQQLDGPDYVAVVVEWSDADDDAVTMTHARPFRPDPSMIGTLVTVVGALSAIALTTWGLRRLSPA
ncbi:MAG: hypothetical protein ABIY55_04475 [Kofleriaceae bacterium]